MNCVESHSPAIEMVAAVNGVLSAHYGPAAQSQMADAAQGFQRRTPGKRFFFLFATITGQNAHFGLFLCCLFF